MTANAQPLDGDATIDEARKWMADTIHNRKGTVCPVCRRHAEIYRVTITASMAQLLITAHAEYGVGKPFRMRTIADQLVSNDRNGARLRAWDLIEPADEWGYWQVTKLGGQFLAGRVSLPKGAILQNNELLKFDYTKMITVNDLKPVGIRPPHTAHDLMNESVSFSEDVDDE